MLIRTLLILVASASLAQAQTKPNILIILTDDQGWGDLSISGNANLKTPQIDSLARDGATLESFYVCQVCAPTRAEFLTGRYYPRTGVSGVTRGEGRLNPDEKTIADMFKEEGYATGAFGKWHNGTQPPYHPNNRGFDEYYGFTSGHWSHYFDVPMDHNGERVRGRGFIVDDITEKAVAFIKQEATAGKPFFCYVPYNTPHSPMMVPNRWFQKFEDFQPIMHHRDHEREDLAMTRSALALCENIDWNVGRLLNALETSGVAKNTIVVFFSDNGPNSYRWNADMKGRKGAIDEGGLRSPFFIRWPDRIAPGIRIPQIAGAIDLVPTLTNLAGIPLAPAPDKPLDGQNLRPLLIPKSGDNTWTDRELFSIKGDQVSIRTQRFRFDAEGQLFDISSDPGQRKDVSKDHPSTTKRLTNLAKRHSEEMRSAFKENTDRPFTVGYGRITQLPVRDAIAQGEIQRSSKAPNNSFLHGWTNPEDSITWDIDVGAGGEYEAILYYTCSPENIGCELDLTFEGGGELRATVSKAFDPPLYDKNEERVENSHYFMKDFAPMTLGTISLGKGRGLLKLAAGKMPGKEMIDVHSLILTQLVASKKQ